MLTVDDRVLVVGGTGMLGKPVVEALGHAGFTVRVLARSAERARQRFPAGVEIAQGDVADPASLAQALQGCAGVHINLKGGPRDADYERIEHQGTRAVVAAAQAAQLRQISYLSAYTVGRDTARSPESRAKWLAEEALRSSGLPYTIYRATWFMESLPLFVQGQQAFVFGRQPHRLHWLAAADYAQMVVRSYLTPAAQGQELYLYGPEAFTMHEALRRYTALAAPQVNIRTLPLALVAAAATMMRNQELQSLATLMGYYNRYGETGDPTLAHHLVGEPTTTLEQWCRERAMRAAQA